MIYAASNIITWCLTLGKIYKDLVCFWFLKNCLTEPLSDVFE